jgi:hypothetical protein
MERQTEKRYGFLLLAGALTLLLLFGCIGGRGASGAQQSGTEASSLPSGPAAQDTPQPGGSVGDADISGSDDDIEAELPGEELIPPPDTSASDISDSDIDLGVMDEDYVISDEDIVEPA